MIKTIEYKVSISKEQYDAYSSDFKLYVLECTTDPYEQELLKQPMLSNRNK